MQAERYRRIDIEQLTRVLGFTDAKRMRDAHRQWVQTALDNGKVQRESHWSESLAVGPPEFHESILKKLHSRHRGRRIVEENGYYELREEPTAYPANFTAEKDTLSQDKVPLVSDS